MSGDKYRMQTIGLHWLKCTETWVKFGSISILPTAASSKAKPNGFAAYINKTICLKVQRTIKLKTENLNRKSVHYGELQGLQCSQDSGVVLFQIAYSL